MKIVFVFIFCAVFSKSFATRRFVDKLYIQPLSSLPATQNFQPLPAAQQFQPLPATQKFQPPKVDPQGSRLKSHRSKWENKRNLPKIIFLKNLLELECLKEYFQQNRLKNQKGLKTKPQNNYSLPPDIKQKSDNENVQLTDRKDSQIKSGANNDKQLFEEKKVVPAAIIATDENSKRLNDHQRVEKNLTDASKELGNTTLDSGKLHETFTEKIQEKPVEGQHQHKVSGNHQHLFEASDYEDPGLGNNNDEKFFKLPLPFNRVTKAPHTESDADQHWFFTRPQKVRPYKVEEPLEESLKVNVNDVSEDENIEDASINEAISNQKDKLEETTQKSPGDALSGINLSAILQGLINPGIRTVTPANQVFIKTTPRVPIGGNRYPQNEGFGKPGPNSFYNKWINGSQPYPNHRLENKPLINPQGWFSGWNQRPSMPQGYRKGFRHPGLIQNQTRPLERYYEDIKNKNQTVSYQKTPLVASRRMDEFVDSSVFNETKQKEANVSLKLEDIAKKVEELTITTLKLSSTREVITTSPITEDREQPITFTATHSFSKSVRSPETSTSDFDLTTFKEFNDDPMAFDLGAEESTHTTQEANWKNSRKMHFSLPSPENFDSAQRRSDILINDAPEDYNDVVDLGNALNTSRPFPNFPNHSRNESLIPFIPIIIGYLRDDNIPSEDRLVLSKMFGKYWPMILDLSNNTNLDMLPLLQMKTQKDFEKVFEKATSGNSTAKADSSTSNVTEDYTYDYLDEFKDLYQEVEDEKIETQKGDHQLYEVTQEYFARVEDKVDGQ